MFESDMIRCPMCNGSAHPSTGCEYTPTFVVCWRCTTEFWKWCISHTSGKGRRKGPSFYSHVNVIKGK